MQLNRTHPRPHGYFPALGVRDLHDGEARPRRACKQVYAGIEDVEQECTAGLQVPTHSSEAGQEVLRAVEVKQGVMSDEDEREQLFKIEGAHVAFDYFRKS